MLEIAVTFKMMAPLVCKAGVIVRLIAGAQNTGGAGIDTLTSIEHLLGSRYGDALTGNALANIFTGGAGLDTLTGQGGADVFRYLDVADSGLAARDRIADFSKAEGDKISLGAIDAVSDAVGNQAFSFIGSGAFSGAAGELRVTYNGTIALLYGDTDGDKQADLFIRVDGTTAAAPLAATDFVL